MRRRAVACPAAGDLCRNATGKPGARGVTRMPVGPAGDLRGCRRPAGVACRRGTRRTRRRSGDVRVDRERARSSGSHRRFGIRRNGGATLPATLVVTAGGVLKACDRRAGCTSLHECPWPLCSSSRALCGRTRRRRAIVAAVIDNALEWTSSSSMRCWPARSGRLFFAVRDETISLLLALATSAACCRGKISRPGAGTSRS